MSDIKQRVWNVLRFKEFFTLYKDIQDFTKYTPEQCYNTAWENVMKGVDLGKLNDYLDMVDVFEADLGKLFLQTTEFAVELKDEFKLEEDKMEVQ